MFPIQPIETKRLTLRPPEFTDARDIFHAYGGNPRVTRYLSWPTHRSPADAEQFLRRLQQAAEQGEECAWVLVERRRQQLCGSVGLRFADGVGHLGYCLAEEYWGQGYAAEAASAVLSVIWLCPDVQRVEAYCHVQNLRSARVLEKVGLRYFGLEPAFVQMPAHGPQKQDVLRYALSRPA